MDKQEESRLYSFLVIRFLIVMCCVVAAELVISQLSGRMMIPMLKEEFQRNSGTGSTAGGIWGLPRFLWAVASGRGDEFVRKTISRSTAAGLVAVILLLHLAPIVAGILIYVRMVGRKIQEMTRKREEEHAAAERQKNLLITDMAHDLRTPMTTVAGYAKALSDGMVPQEKQREYLQAIVSKTSRMNEMITELFEYSKLGSEGFRLNKEKFDLHELLLRVAAEIYTDMEDAGMIFEVEMPDEPVIVYADRGQVTRAFSNLLVNAMRHNPRGTEIILTAQRKAGEETVAVMDSGAMLPEDVPVFEPFVKSDPARKGPGSGLGLSIVRMIVEMHGWHVALQQPYRDGMKAFVVSIPM